MKGVANQPTCIARVFLLSSRTVIPAKAGIQKRPLTSPGQGSRQTHAHPPVCCRSSANGPICGAGEMGASRTHWVSRELLARAWAAEAGPDDAPLTIDLDSTICETYGLAKEGARHHGYTGQRGNHPLLVIAAGTGDVLMSRLREGRANTARRAASPGIFPSAGPGRPSSVAPWPDCAPCHSCLTAPPSPDPLTGQPIVLANSRQPSPRVVLCCVPHLDPVPSGDCRLPSTLQAATAARSRSTVRLRCRPDNRARSPQHLRSVAVSPSFGGFGLRWIRAKEGPGTRLRRFSGLVRCRCTPNGGLWPSVVGCPGTH